MVHTMKLVRHCFPQFVGHKIVAVSPCPAKKREFEETGWGDYNVTYASLREHHRDRDIDLDAFPEAEFDLPSPATAAVFPMPGGLLHALEHY